MLHALCKGSCCIQVVNDHTVLLSDVAVWNTRMQEEVMHHFPDCYIDIEMSVHSLCGFVIRFQKRVCESSLYMLYFLFFYS